MGTHSWLRDLEAVAAGHIGPAHVRDLRGVLEREKAELGVLVSMREPTLSMRREASAAGDYLSVVWDEKYPRIQLLTAEGLLAGKEVRYPRGDKLVGRLALAQQPEGELIEPRMVEPRRQDLADLKKVERSGTIESGRSPS